MALKKSDLYQTLWASCDELRGGMDASEYKDYVLMLLFIRYVSDKYAGQGALADIEVPAGASFADLSDLKGKADIGNRINVEIVGPLAKAAGLTDVPDFNNDKKLGEGKAMVQRLTNLVAIFENPALDFRKNRADHDDILGDAYEYLMRHFATQSGKSKGQFYTPAEVSRLLAALLGIESADTTAGTTVYDPTCGSGSLLLKVADAATTSVSLYGQEKDNTTADLARMNMILHQQAAAETVQGNTLTDPKFTNRQTGALKTFDYVVANPPFSDKGWSTGLNPDTDPYGRFDGFGVPPNKQGDYAYLLHIVRSLKSTGTAACILPHGVLFRGNAEAAIRQNLLRRGLVKAVIGLPPNLFYGTGIPACVIVLGKQHAHARKAVHLIDASRGFLKDGNKNRLRARDLHRIVDAYTAGNDVPRFARVVPIEEIADNDYNLNLPRYLDVQEPEDLQDLAGHLQGGVPDADIDALAPYWKVCPDLEATLFTENRPGYRNLAVPAADISATIDAHPQFIAFVANAARHFDIWCAEAASTLSDLEPGDHVKSLIHDLSETLLAHYANQPLVDRYPVYQHLMDYWAETLQDDAYLIAADGWIDAAQPRRIIETTKSGKTMDKGWYSELVPKAVLVARYFADEQAAIDQLEADIAKHEADLSELEEDQSGETDEGPGVFADFEKVNAAAVKALLKEIKSDASSTDDDAKAEIAVLKAWQALDNARASDKKKHKAAATALDDVCFEKFDDLDEEDLKTLVIDDKWLHIVGTRITGETDRVRQTLAGRIKVLANRYAETMGDLAAEADALELKVAGHLEAMGLS